MTAVTDETRPDAWALTLSGGGFRATLFHLGVVRFLRDANLLQRFTHIFSVSGGSILAAHLVLHWDRYCGTDEEFESAAEEIIDLVRSDVRGRVIRRWILSWLVLVPQLLRLKSVRMTALFQRALSLFVGARLSDLRESRPALHLLSTSLTTGALFSFTASGVEYDQNGKFEQIGASRVPISLAVAASAAFPPLFPPVPLARELFKASQKQLPFEHHLADGGVYDNLGVRKLHALRDVQFQEVVLSDAGSKADWRIGIAYGFLVGRAIRASDLLMQRVADLEYLALGERAAPVTYCRIDEELSPTDTPLDEETQRGLASLRTDLDRFSPWEINALVQHGFAVARKACRNLPQTAERLANELFWMPRSTRAQWNPDAAIDRALERGKAHALRLWDARDWVSWALLALLPVILAPIWFPIYQRAVIQRTHVQYVQIKKDNAALRARQGAVTAPLQYISAFTDCPGEGEGGDPLLNLLKNRDIPPPTSTELPLSELIADSPPILEQAGKNRDAWSSAALAEASKREQSGVTVSAYVTRYKREGPDSSNCKSATDTNIHVWLAERPNAPPGSAVIGVLTPRVLSKYPRLVPTLQAAMAAKQPVRVGGWRLWNQVHKEQLREVRATLWELHPITSVEIDPHPDHIVVVIEENKSFTDVMDAAPVVGSSRVDLQACKLEYSIVSPK